MNIVQYKKISFLLLLLLTVVLSGCNKQTTVVEAGNNQEQKKEAVTQTNQVSNEYPVSSAETIADKVQVFLFHTTHRCSSCIAIGKLANETVNERFADELKAGKIEFREINIDLPENKELARKFKASGSSLFLNAIYNKQDHIEHNTMVWRLISNSDKYKDYLSGEINILFGR